MTASTAEALSLEFLELPEISVETIDDSQPQEVWVNVTQSKGFGGNKFHSFLGKRVGVHNRPSSFRNEKGPDAVSRKSRVSDVPIPTANRWNPEVESVNFASHSTYGILDSGATKSVVGSEQLSSLLEGLHPEVRKRTRRCQCHITFRFGNQGTLDSQHAIVIPIGQLGLKIAIVPGQTPLLISNTLVRTLQSQIDTASHQLHSRHLTQPIKLHLSSKGLFLVDINDLALHSRGARVTAETFVHDTLNRESSEKSRKLDVSHSVPPSGSAGEHEVQTFTSSFKNVEDLSVKPNSDSNVEVVHSADHSSESHPPCRDSSSLAHSHHEPCRPPVSCAVDPRRGWPGKFQEEVPGRDACRTHHIRPSPSGQNIPGGVGQRASLAEMVPEDLYESSNKTDHLRLIRYCSLMIERMEMEANLPELEPEQMPVIPKAKPKPKARPATQIGSLEPPAEFPRSDEEDLESWGAVPPIETDENISALQQRMLHMENAMTEVLTHLRAQRQ